MTTEKEKIKKTKGVKCCNTCRYREETGSTVEWREGPIYRCALEHFTWKGYEFTDTHICPDFKKKKK